MTVEQLVIIIHLILDRCKIDEIEVNGEGFEEVCVNACVQIGVDERFWRPIYLAFYWMNDLEEWADGPNLYTRAAMKAFQAEPDDDLDEEEG